MQLSFKHLFLIALSFYFVHGYGGDLYKNELAQFIQGDDYKQTFGNRDLDHGLKTIRADIITSHYISWLERFTTSLFGLFISGAITITPERMPLLYNYIDNVCKNQNIKTPTIIITKSKSFFNAFALKLFSFGGFICIGQQIILETSDAALEAIVAHELGHIKNNHATKLLFLGFALPIAYCIYKHIRKPNMLTDDPVEQMASNVAYYAEQLKFAKKWLLPASFLTTKAIFSRSMERQADEFTYKTLNKGDGLIEFFELNTEKKLLHNQSFVDTYAMLQKYRSSLSYMNYLDLTLSFWMTNVYDWLNQLYALITHPSDEARIAAIREYQQSLEANPETNG